MSNPRAVQWSQGRIPWEVAMDLFPMVLSAIALAAVAGWTIFHKDNSTSGTGRHRARPGGPV
jgi:hypothetical protein